MLHIVLSVHCVEWAVLVALPKRMGGACITFLLCQWCMKDNPSVMRALIAPPCFSGTALVQATPPSLVREAQLAVSQPKKGRN